MIHEMKLNIRAVFGCLLNGRTLQDEVPGGHLHLLVELSFHPVVYRIEHCINCRHWLVRRLSTFFEYACPHKDRIPFVLRLRIELIRAFDIAFLGVPHEVYSFWGSIDTILVLPPLL